MLIVCDWVVLWSQEKFKRGFRRLFRRCHCGPAGRDRRFSSAGEVSLTGAFHVEDVDACSATRRSRRGRQPRGSDASSVNVETEKTMRCSAERTSTVSVHCQHSTATNLLTLRHDATKFAHRKQLETLYAVIW